MNDSVTANETADSAVRASLVFRGFEGPPSGITQAIGLEPSRTGLKGESRENVLGRASRELNKESYWSLRSGAPPRESIETHILRLLERALPQAHRIRQLPDTVTKQVYCTVIPGESVPIIRLGQEALAGLADLRVALVVDILSVGDRSTERPT